MGGSGAAYVYKLTRDSNNVPVSWSQEAYIKAVQEWKDDDKFGKSIDLNNGTLVLGAPDERSNQTTSTNGDSASSNRSSNRSGAVYIYNFTGE